MQRLSLRDIFLVKQITRDKTSKETANRNYFEIIFIISGRGKLFVNEFIIRYEKGDIFLIAPKDQHHFEIDE